MLIVNGGSFERVGFSLISHFNGSYDNKKSDEGDVNMNVRNIKLYVGVIVLLICVWLIIVPRLKLYEAKRNARTLIEKIEWYHRIHNCYPKTIDAIGLKVVHENEEFRWHGFVYMYTQVSESEFELDLRLDSRTYVFYSIANEWYMAQSSSAINQLKKKLYEEILLKEKNGEVDSVVIEEITKSNRDSVRKHEGINTDNLYFVRKYYRNKQIAGKGYALINKEGKKMDIRNVGIWTVFTSDGRSFHVAYSENDKRSYVIEYIDVNFDL